MMPPPDGLSLIRRAKATQPQLEAIAITGHSGQYQLSDALAAGTSDLLLKPFRMDELTARIALAAERRRAVETLREQRNTLHQVSTDMIKGLQNEIVEARSAAGNAAHRARTAATARPTPRQAPAAETDENAPIPPALHRVRKRQ